MSEPPELHTEDELVQLFRETGDAFRPDRQAMVLGAVAHGRRLRRRRTGAVVGGAAALALVAFGGVVAGGVTTSGHPPVEPGLTVSSDSSPTPSTTRPGLTDEQMVAALARHLTGHRVVGTRGVGTDSLAANGATKLLAELSVDDGALRFVVTVDLWREPAMTVKELRLAAMLCDGKGGKTVVCTTTDEAGDAVLTLRRPLVRVPGFSWSYVLASPDGRRVSVTEWIGGTPSGAADVPPDPPLGLSGLRGIALDRVWDRALTGAPVVNSAQEPAAAG